MTILQSGIAKPSSGYDIEQSLRFDDGDSAYLSRTPGSAGNRRTWTLSWWEKKTFPNNGYVYSQGTNGATNNILIGPNDTEGRLWIREVTSSSADVFGWKVDSYARDPGAWYHFVVAVDTTQVTSTNRVKVYINGVQQTLTAAGGGAPSLNLETELNNTTTGYIGAWTTSGAYKDGYLAEFHLIDGTALTQASFGETDAATNQWKPIEYDGSYGTNGFYQKYSSTELAASFTDSADKNATPTTVTTQTAQKKFGTASALCVNNASYLQIPESPDWAFSGPFTIEFWVRLTDAASDITIFDHWLGSGDNRVFQISYNATASGRHRFQWSPNGTSGSAVDVDYTSVLSADTWYHIAWCRDGDDDLRFFVDGTQVGSTATTVTGAAHDGDVDLKINVGGANGGDISNYMDEIRISNSARYTSNFSVETSAFTTDGNTKLLLHCDGSDDGTSFPDSSESANRHTITPEGDVTNTRAVDKFQCDYLVVGGGGGGGGILGGGGGAGDYRTGVEGLIVNKSYTVTVGDGGAGNSGSGNGGDGDSSIFSTITSIGGGGGGSDDPENGRAGGSGGGGGTDGGPDAVGSGGSSTAYGNDGGSAYDSSPTFTGGGGGGSGAVGSNGATGGAGGAGTANSITGASVTYAGGGGGCGRGTGAAGGTGGSGGGGNGSSNAIGGGAVGTAGTANTGSGGGGGDAGSSAAGGGSGIVIISYVSATALATGGTITTYTSGVNTYQVHSFTSNGTFTPTSKNIPGTSSIKFDGTGDYLSSVFSEDFNILSSTDDFTVEFWMRSDVLINSDTTFIGTGGEGDANTLGWNLGYYQAGLQPTIYDTSPSVISWTWTNKMFYSIDFAADTWYHIAWVRDSGDFRGYIDGVKVFDVTDKTTVAAPTSTPLEIGRNVHGNRYFTGYMDEIRISDSARYTVNFTPSTTAFVADANTKLLIHSDFNGGLGADSSGNKNDFAPTNLVATDQMLDTPTNNYCTYNPLAKSYLASTFSEGNLKVTAGSGWNAVPATFAVSSGKWYMEFVPTTTNSRFYMVGDNSSGFFDDAINPQTGNAAIGYIADGNKAIDNTETSYGATFASGDIIGVALNMEDSEVTFYKNNASQGAISFSGGITSAASVMPFAVGAWYGDTWTYANFGQDSSFAGTKTAQGNGGDGEDFYYTPPSGFVALNTDNLSAPSIADPTKHFNTVLYTGDGNTGRSVTGTGFAPGFLWIKNRDATDNYINVDSVRGPTIYWSSNSGGTFTTDSNVVTSLDSNGFTVGDNAAVNTNTEDFVSWNWLCGDSFDPTAGSATVTTATGNANTTAGISVVKYVGPGGASDSFAHGLSQAVEFAIIKADAGDGAATGATPMTWDGTILLSGNSAFYDSATYWRDTAPDASLVYIGTAGEVNDGGGATSYSAYCFHSVEGYSKVGTYEGNGNADGPFVYTGFQPAFWFVKSIDTTYNWYINDLVRNPYNVSGYELYANTTEAEGSATRLDLISNGFKARGTQVSGNASGVTYLYYAVASSPFKYSNAR